MACKTFEIDENGNKVRELTDAQLKQRLLEDNDLYQKVAGLSAEKKKTGKQLREERLAFDREVVSAEPSNIREWIMQYFAGGGKINTDDFKSETGFGIKNKEGRTRGLSEFRKRIWMHNKLKDTPTMARLIENLQEDWRTNFGEEIDEQDARNEIISVMIDFDRPYDLIEALRNEYEINGKIVKDRADRAGAKEEAAYWARREEYERSIGNIPENKLGEFNDEISELERMSIEEMDAEADMWWDSLSKEEKEQLTNPQEYEKQTERADKGLEKKDDVTKQTDGDSEKIQQLKSDAEQAKRKFLDAENEYAKITTALDKDVAKKQGSMFDGKEQKLFDDSADLAKQAKEAKRKLDEAKEAYDKAQGLVDDKLKGQIEMDLKDAQQELLDALKELRDAPDITKNNNFAAKNVGEKTAEAMDKVHKALVKYAKALIAKGVTDVKKFAREVNLSAKNVMKAWDEANGGKQYKVDELDYDMADIAKTAVRRGIKVREKLLEVIDEQKTKTKNVTKSLQAIRDFVKEYSDRGNLTRDDYQKILDILPSIKNQKTLDKAADKILDIINNAKSDKIEVSERTLLKDRIKAEVKAANEGYRQARLEQKDIAQAIKDFMDDTEIKGALSPNQVKVLVKRAASVNTEKQFENFIDYADKVIKDVNFAEDVAEIESAQRKANSRNHVSQNNIVKEFTSVSPESIPENLWDDYMAALADLTARVPSYKKMTDMYYSITQFAKQPSPFDAVKTFDEADKALKSALSNKIGTLDEYKQLLKDIRAFEKRVNGLFENGDITKQNYDDLLDALSSKREKFDAQFGGQVGQLKDQLLAEANAVKKSKEFKDAVSKVDNKVDKDLLNELEVQTDEDLKALSPQALSDLADVYQNVIDGYVDHYRIRDIVAKSEGARNGKQVKEQLDKAKIEVANVGELAEEMGLSEAAFREGDIGLGRAKAGAVTKYIYDPILRAITKSQNQTQNGVKLLKEAFGNHNKQSRLRMGIVANALQEYMAQFNPEFANVKDIGNRDWVAEIFAKGNANGFNSLEEANDVAKAWYSLNKTKATIKLPLPIIGKKKLAEISGDPISPKEIYDSFIANDGKFLTKEEHKALSTWFEYAGDTNFNTQRAANEMKGKEMNKEPFYAPRIREGSNIFGEDNVTLDEKNTRISITSGFGKSRTSQAIEPIQFDISISGEKAIANANKDYELTKALKEVNATLDAALKDGADPSVIEAIKKDVQHSLSNQYNNRTKSGFTDKLTKLLSTSIQLNPLKTVKEFAATISSMPIRGGKPQGIAELFKANGFKELIEYTGSPLSERFNINKQFELTDGEVEDLRPLQKLAYLLGGLPELTMMQTVYMPNFKAEFKAITGNEYSARDFKNDPSYRVKNARALRDANAIATNEVQKIIGGGSKFSARRDIKIPFGKVKADTFEGKVLGFMGGYPYREQKEFWNGFKEVAERRKEGEGLASLGSLRKPLAVTINTMVYSYMGAMLKTMVAQVMDEKEEKEKEKLLEEKFTPKGVTSALVGQLSNVTAAKYGSIGTNLAKSAFAIAAYNLEDEEQQKVLTSIAKENFFGMQPDFDRLTSENKYARQTAMKLEMAKLIPAIGEAVTAWDAMGSSYNSAAELVKAKQEGKSLTKSDEEIYNLLNLSINALHLAMMTQGGGVPSYYDLQKIIESKKKKEPRGIVN